VFSKFFSNDFGPDSPNFHSIFAKINQRSKEQIAAFLLLPERPASEKSYFAFFWKKRVRNITIQ
jgi:hypothetical protein